MLTDRLTPNFVTGSILLFGRPDPSLLDLARRTARARAAAHQGRIARPLHRRGGVRSARRAGARLLSRALSRIREPRRDPRRLLGAGRLARQPAGGGELANSSQARRGPAAPRGRNPRRHPCERPGTALPAAPGRPSRLRGASGRARRARRVPGRGTHPSPAPAPRCARSGRAADAGGSHLPGGLPRARPGVLLRAAHRLHDRDARLPRRGTHQGPRLPARPRSSSSPIWGEEARSSRC